MDDGRAVVSDSLPERLGPRRVVALLGVTRLQVRGGLARLEHRHVEHSCSRTITTVNVRRHSHKHYRFPRRTYP
jgi:DNA-binding FadR family transcriptional regulator